MVVGLCSRDRLLDSLLERALRLAAPRATYAPPSSVYMYMYIYIYVYMYRSRDRLLDSLLERALRLAAPRPTYAPPSSVYGNMLDQNIFTRKYTQLHNSELYTQPLNPPFHGQEGSQPSSSDGMKAHNLPPQQDHAIDADNSSDSRLIRQLPEPLGILCWTGNTWGEP